MRHHRQGRDGNNDAQRERINHRVHRQAEDIIKLGRPYCEAADYDNLTIFDEQQDRDNDAAEIRCDQTDGRRIEG
eukprot:2498351-Heterocapsa_arctica.AAC.1